MNESGKSERNAMETLAAHATDYKHVIVNLYKVNGNALVVAGTVRKALKRAGALLIVLVPPPRTSKTSRSSIRFRAKPSSLSESMPRPRNQASRSFFTSR